MGVELVSDCEQAVHYPGMWVDGSGRRLVRPADDLRRLRENGAVDLYDLHGAFIERISFTGAHMSLAIDLVHLVPRLLTSGCNALILRHDHPSGLAKPSIADIETTRAFAGLLRTLGILLHDHIIEGGGEQFSFRRHGLL